MATAEEKYVKSLPKDYGKMPEGYDFSTKGEQ